MRATQETMQDNMEPKASEKAAPSRLMEALAILVVTSLLILIVLPTLNRMRESAGRSPCASNLRQIGQAIAIYANENGGQYPDSVDMLLAVDLTPEAFVCPSTKDEPATGATTDEIRALVRAGGGHVSYIYIGAGLTSAADSDVVVAYDRPANHEDDGCNVLWGDGHIDWVPMKSMQYVLGEVAAGRLPVRRPQNPTTSRPTTMQTTTSP